MKVLRFDLILLGPVLVANTEPGDENSAVGCSYLPGSSIRGALIACYLDKTQQKTLDLIKDKKAVRWFFDEQLFLNAYPAPQGERMLPTPLSWRVEKEFRRAENAEICDAARALPDIEQPVTLVETFYSMETNSSPLFHEPQRAMEIHNSGWKRRVKGEGISQVYRYDALAAGQVFSGMVLGQDFTEFIIRVGLQNGARLRIGRSRGAHYGLVEVQNLHEEPFELEGRLLPQSDRDGKLLELILTSDALLYDEMGQPMFDLDNQVGAQHLSIWRKTSITGGFNRTWGLPLPQGLTIKAGSVFVYKAEQVDSDRVNELLKKGVGLRRAEGYGRIMAVLDPLEKLQRTPMPLILPAVEETAPQLTSDDSRQMANLIAQRCLQEIIQRKLEASVANLILENMEDRAQLSRLRIVTRQAQEQQDLKLLSSHLSDLKSAQEKVRQARVRLESARSRGQPRLEEWILKLVDDGELNYFWREAFPTEQKLLGWADLLAPSAAEREAIIGYLMEDPDWEREIKITFICRLIDAMLKKATRKAQHMEWHKEEVHR